MILIAQRIGRPEMEPVTLEEMKQHLRVDFNEEDSLISSLISTARELCEDRQGRSYLPQKWRITFDELPSMPLLLPRPPLLAIHRFMIRDNAGKVEEIDPASITVDTYTEPGRIYVNYPAHLPENISLSPLSPVIIEYVAGWEKPQDIEEKVKQAIKLLVAYWYENREAASDKLPKQIEFSVAALLWNGRVIP